MATTTRLGQKASDDRYQSLIATLRKVRIAKDLSQGELASILGVPQQFVSRVEVGSRRLDAVELVDYAKALGLNATDLIGNITPR
jgi:transcriptional regulator with XRE-family HTH domain